MNNINCLRPLIGARLIVGVLAFLCANLMSTANAQSGKATSPETCKNLRLDGAEMAFVGCRPMAAYRMAQELAKKGDPKALFILGRIYELGGKPFGLQNVKEDFELAQKYFLASARKDYTEAQATIGWIYSKYYGDTKELEGLYWFCKAASKNNEEAIGNLDVYVKDHHINQSRSDFCQPILKQEPMEN